MQMEGLEGHYIANYIVGPPGTITAGTAYDDLDSKTGAVHGISGWRSLITRITRVIPTTTNFTNLPHPIAPLYCSVTSQNL